MSWNLSCLDWEDRIRAGRSLIPDLPLFTDEADAAIAFYDQLRLPDVPGTPRMAEASGQWFRDIVGAVFGSRDPATNERHIREFFGLVGKGNSKTTNGAALMLVALLMNIRPRAELLFVGPTQAISDLAYTQASGMIDLDPELKKRFHARDYIKAIEDRSNRATLRVKTFDESILTGPRPAAVLLDELHLLGKTAATGRVLRQIRGGMEKMPEAFMIMISTQSDQPPAGAFAAELKMARSIRDGQFAGRMLPILYEYPGDIMRDENKWRDQRNWPMVMPNLGRSIQLASLAADYETERAKGKENEQVWASQHLNIEIGVGLKSDRWRGADHWAGATDPTLTLDALLDRSEVICAGVDGGGLDDLLGLALIGRERITRRWLHWARAWLHVKVLELRKSEAQRFLDLVDAGELVLVEDMQDAFDELAEIVASVEAVSLLAEVGLDPMGVGMIVDALAEQHIEGDERVKGVSQGWTLNGAIKTAEVKVANRTLIHGGQALMAYAVGNARTVPRGNAVTITKEVSGTAKIDPLMATFDAIALMSKNPEARGKSIYETMTPDTAKALGLVPPADDDGEEATQPAPQRQLAFAGGDDDDDDEVW